MHNQMQPLNPTALHDLEVLAADAGVSPSVFLETLRSLLRRVPDPARALNNLDRFLRSGFATAVIRDFAAQRVLLEIALELFAQSQFLADILVRDPELFRWLTTTSALSTQKGRATYVEEAKQASELFQRTERKLDSLKRYHRRELLHLGAREILEKARMPEITAELSWLADAIVEAVLGIALHQMELRTGVRFESQFAVIGLGKLGGEELNFSSDIDLLFVYEQDDELAIPAERIHSLHELYVRIGEMMVRMLTERTQEGHLYRVDMRLRPDGTAGPLALSRQGYRNYYETRGELWERQMLTKARVIAGNRAVGERWMEDIRPFVYPKTVVQSPMAEILAMKRRIEARAKEKDSIKVGSGGIRDIEFIVQALQLLSGGNFVELQNPNTLRALQALQKYGKMTSLECERLTDAYLFLRRVEHRLQLLHGLQTHSLPKDDQEMGQLSRRLGFATVEEFKRALDGHRNSVREIFTSLFTPDHEGNSRQASVRWRESQGSVSTLLVRAGLEEQRAAELEEMVNTLGIPSFTAQNLTMLIQPGGARILVEGLRNEKIAELITMLCARSSVLVERLAREPLLVESLIGQTDRLMSPGPVMEFLKATDLLRYREYNEFKALLRFVVGKCTVHDLRQELSALAEEIVVQLFTTASQKVSEHVPIPHMSLIALGRLGSRGMNLRSDIDLLLLYDDADHGAGFVAERILKEMLRLNTTAQGRVYEIDFRLRPEGKNAPLAVGLNYFRIYHEVRGELWERQMLTRARIIAGDKPMNAAVQRLLHSIVYKKSMPGRWAGVMIAMRKRMEQERGSGGSGFINIKVDRGCIADIEFLIQALQLVFGNRRVSLRENNEPHVLRRAMRSKILTSARARLLLENFTYLHTLETFLRLNGGTSSLQADSDAVGLWAHVMNEPSASSLLRKIRKIQRENRKFLIEYLRTWERKPNT
jgi:glutamate-ammonia-ligase adenylyltransferase